LGENNLYLHGMPWLFAPDEQKQVPLIVWLSDGFQQRYQLSAECLQAQRERELSHDNLPHSLLGLMSVRTEVYNAELDLFAGCREANQARVVHSSGSSAEAEI
jgi:lipid A ethanolaminephosphotransferase